LLISTKAPFLVYIKRVFTDLDPSDTSSADFYSDILLYDTFLPFYFEGIKATCLAPMFSKGR